MGPKWSRPVASDFEEEARVNRLHGTYKMLANEETACTEIWASADPSIGIRAVLWVERHLALHVNAALPLGFERLSPIC